jgi:hypothetical protein
MMSQLPYRYYLTYHNHLRYIIVVLSRHLPGGTEDNEKPVRIVGVPAETRTQHLPNISLELPQHHPPR